MLGSVVIGIDPGLKGGISILGDKLDPVVYRIPTKKKIVNKKNKNTYDIEGIIKIFSAYIGKDVDCLIEKQGVRPGEGSISAMTIGENYGLLQGIAYGMGFNVIIARSQDWKKAYPVLTNSKEIVDLKESIKSLKEDQKKLKDKDDKKGIKREIDSLSRKVKVIAKDAARTLATDLYPYLSDNFKLKNQDGCAESVLIARYGLLSYKE